MSDFLLSIQPNFSNRALATGLWLLIAFILGLFVKTIRSGFWSIVKATLQTILLILFGTLGAYVTGLCWLLFYVDLWTTNQLLPTFMWVILSGIALTGRAISAQEDYKFIKTTILDSFKIVVVIEFLVAAYSFDLLTELIIVPFTIFVGLMIGFSAIKKEYEFIKTLFEWVAFGVVVLLLWKSVGSIWSQPEAFFTTRTGRNFILPPLLTIGLIPFAYFWYCYSNIETARIRINLKTFQSDKLKRYARRHFFTTFMAKPWLLRRATRQFHDMPASTYKDVDQIISDILIFEKHSRNPPTVDENLGWSPHLARKFLEAEGLRTGDYYMRHGPSEWWARSDCVDLDDQIPPNRIAYYVEGNRDLANTLRLKGYFRSDDTISALEKLKEIACALLELGIPDKSRCVQNAIKSENDFDLVIDKTRVSQRTEPCPSEKGYELHLILSRNTS